MKYDFAKILKRIQQSSVNVPRIQFVAEPKVSLPLPPPKEAAPTVTTVAATIGVIRRSQYFARSPKIPSIIPPTNTAPTIAL